MATDWNCLFHRSLRAYIFCNCFSQLLKTKHSNLAICFAIGNVMSPIISINSFVIFSRCWLSHHSRFVTELVCFKRKDKLKILRQFYTIDCPVKGQYSKFSIIWHFSKWLKTFAILRAFWLKGWQTRSQVRLFILGPTCQTISLWRVNWIWQQNNPMIKKFLFIFRNLGWSCWIHFPFGCSVLVADFLFETFFSFCLPFRLRSM